MLTHSCRSLVWEELVWRQSWYVTILRSAVGMLSTRILIYLGCKCPRRTYYHWRRPDTVSPQSGKGLGRNAPHRHFRLQRYCHRSTCGPSRDCAKRCQCGHRDDRCSAFDFSCGACIACKRANHFNWHSDGKDDGAQSCSSDDRKSTPQDCDIHTDSLDWRKHPWVR